MCVCVNLRGGEKLNKQAKLHLKIKKNTYIFLLYKTKIQEQFQETFLKLFTLNFLIVR